MRERLKELGFKDRTRCSGQAKMEKRDHGNRPPTGEQGVGEEEEET